MSSYRDVKAQIAKLEKQAADLFKKEVAEVVAKIKGLMQEYGLSTSDLDLKGKSAKTQRAKKANFKPAGVPKYRDPATGKTWTGHGKAPAHQGCNSREDSEGDKVSQGQGHKARRQACYQKIFGSQEASESCGPEVCGKETGRKSCKAAVIGKGCHANPGAQ